MQDQNQITPEPQAPTPTKIVDIMAQPAPVEPPTASVAAPDPELVSEPAVEPAPAPAPAEAPKEERAAQTITREDVKKQATPKSESALATPAKPKQHSTVPVGAIIVAIIMFLALATVALIAFRQGF